MPSYPRDSLKHQATMSLSFLNPLNWFKFIGGLFSGNDDGTQQYASTGMTWEAMDPTLWIRSMMHDKKSKKQFTVVTLQGKQVMLDPSYKLAAEILSFIMFLLGMYAIYLAVACTNKVFSMQLLYALIFGPLYVPFRLAIPCGTGGSFFNAGKPF